MLDRLQCIIRLQHVRPDARPETHGPTADAVMSRSLGSQYVGVPRAPRAVPHPRRRRLPHALGVLGARAHEARHLLPRVELGDEALDVPERSRVRALHITAYEICRQLSGTWVNSCVYGGGRTWEGGYSRAILYRTSLERTRLPRPVPDVYSCLCTACAGGGADSSRRGVSSSSSIRSTRLGRLPSLGRAET